MWQLETSLLPPLVDVVCGNEGCISAPLLTTADLVAAVDSMPIRASGQRKHSPTMVIASPSDDSVVLDL